MLEGLVVISLSTFSCLGTLKGLKVGLIERQQYLYIGILMSKPDEIRFIGSDFEFFWN